MCVLFVLYAAEDVGILNAAAGAQHVVECVLLCKGGIARLDRFHDHAMFCAGDLAVEDFGGNLPGVVEHHLVGMAVDAAKALVVGAECKVEMEVAVQHQPKFLIAFVCGSFHGIHGIVQTTKHLAHILAVLLSFRQSIADHGVQRRDDLIGMDDIFLFGNAHKRATILDALDQAILLQTVDGFTHGGTADGKLLCDGGFYQFLTGTKLVGDKDHPTDAVIGDLRCGIVEIFHKIFLPPYRALCEWRIKICRFDYKFE